MPDRTLLKTQLKALRHVETPVGWYSTERSIPNRLHPPASQVIKWLKHIKACYMKPVSKMFESAGWNIHSERKDQNPTRSAWPHHRAAPQPRVNEKTIENKSNQSQRSDKCHVIIHFILLLQTFFFIFCQK